MIDDHVLVLRGMVRLLLGLETRVATSAREAWSLLESGQFFDVIVSDVMMNDMTGPDLYARCFERAPELARRFVFASADPRAAQALIEAALAQVGADQAPPLLAKPTSRDALLAAVTSVAAKAVPQSGTYAIRLPGSVAPVNEVSTRRAVLPRSNER